MRYLYIILLNQHVKVFASPQTLAKKLHPLSLSRQKNCTPSGFHGKKIAHSLAANLSEIAIWCATWTGMQNNCSIIKLYYRVLIIIFAYFRNYKQRFECLKINDYWKKISHLHTYLIAQVVLYIIQTSAINMMNIYVYWLIQFKSGSPLDGVSLTFLAEFTTKLGLKFWKQLP